MMFLKVIELDCRTGLTKTNPGPTLSISILESKFD